MAREREMKRRSNLLPPPTPLVLILVTAETTQSTLEHPLHYRVRPRNPSSYPSLHRSFSSPTAELVNDTTQALDRCSGQLQGGVGGGRRRRRSGR